jgi:hypothetical protein
MPNSLSERIRGMIEELREKNLLDVYSLMYHNRHNRYTLGKALSISFWKAHKKMREVQRIFDKWIPRESRHLFSTTADV